LIGLVHNAFFLGHLSFAYDASHFTAAAPWGALVILVPVVGGLVVTWIVSTFAPEAKGHGVPEVMDAIYHKRGVTRPVAAVVKSIASALAIGSGAAVGREGPIIQIGSALGSTLGQLVRMTAEQRITLVAGAGAGIAATFNTPIGDVLFAIELMMPEISVNTFLPAAIATGTATFLGRLFFWRRPGFLCAGAARRHSESAGQRANADSLCAAGHRDRCCGSVADSCATLGIALALRISLCRPFTCTSRPRGVGLLGIGPLP